MKLGILSDSHNDVQTLQRALSLFWQQGVTRLLHCGDVTSPDTAVLLTPLPLIYTPGNMDRPQTITKIKQMDTGNIVTAVYTGTLDGLAIAATHGHRFGELERLIGDGRYDFVFHGHTHRRRDDASGATRIINPGALGGRRPEPRSVAVLDTPTRTVTFITIDD